jgi:hypothetical protein
MSWPVPSECLNFSLKRFECCPQNGYLRLAQDGQELSPRHLRHVRSAAQRNKFSIKEPNGFLKLGIVAM